MGFKPGLISLHTQEEFEQYAIQSKSISELAKCLGYKMPLNDGARFSIISRLVVLRSNLDHWVNDPRESLERLYLKKYDRSIRKKAPNRYRTAYNYVRPSDTCQICNLGPIWNGKPTEFEIDHINGDRWDCRICNLRRICPNCHRQQSTSSAGYAKNFMNPDKHALYRGEFRKTLKGRKDSHIFKELYNGSLLRDFVSDDKKGTPKSFERHVKGDGVPRLVRTLDTEFDCQDLSLVSKETLVNVLKVIKMEDPRDHGFVLNAIAVLACHPDLKSWKKIGNRRATNRRLPDSRPLFSIVPE